MSGLTDIKGIGPTTAAALRDHGFADAEAIAAADLSALAEVPGFGAIRAAAVRGAAHSVTGTAQVVATSSRRAAPAIATEASAPDKTAAVTSYQEGVDETAVGKTSGKKARRKKSPKNRPDKKKASRKKSPKNKPDKKKASSKKSPKTTSPKGRMGKKKPGKKKSGKKKSGK